MEMHPFSIGKERPEMPVKKVRWYHYLLGIGMGIAMLILGMNALLEWHATGQMPLHHGIHRSVSYEDDPFSFAYELGGNVLLIFLGLTLSLLFICGAVSRWVRRTS
jgi:hypothetical protein